MADPPPQLVTLHLWHVPVGGVPGALARMAAHRRPVRAAPGLRFAKLLGTGDGRTFRARDADLRRWGLLATWDSPAAAAAFESSRPVRSWDGLADERWRVELAPVASRGSWSGRRPFGDPHHAHRPDGPVAALTRARLRLRSAPTFWRAVPPVSAALQRTDGLLLSLGVGEAPVGLQGTFSLWRDSRALVAFAHRGAPHRAVVDATDRLGWYAEELFARFAVLRAEGSVDGRDPLATTVHGAAA